MEVSTSACDVGSRTSEVNPKPIPELGQRRAPSVRLEFTLAMSLSVTATTMSVRHQEARLRSPNPNVPYITSLLHGRGANSPHPLRLPYPLGDSFPSLPVVQTLFISFSPGGPTPPHPLPLWGKGCLGFVGSHRFCYPLDVVFIPHKSSEMSTVRRAYEHKKRPA